MNKLARDEDSSPGAARPADLPRTLVSACFQVYTQPKADVEVEIQSGLPLHLLRLALPVRRRQHHVLLSEFFEVVVDVVLRVTGTRAHLRYELLDVTIVRSPGSAAFSFELGLPAYLLRLKGRVGSLGRLGGHWHR